MVWFGLWDLLVWVVALMGITTGYETLAQRLRLRQCRKSTAFIRFLYIPCLYFTLREVLPTRSHSPGGFIIPKTFPSFSSNTFINRLTS